MNIGIITGASSGMGKEFVKLTMQNHLELDEIWVIARRKERLEAWSDLYTARDLVLWEGFRRFLWKSRLRW